MLIGEHCFVHKKDPLVNFENKTLSSEQIAKTTKAF